MQGMPRSWVALPPVPKGPLPMHAHQQHSQQPIPPGRLSDFLESGQSLGLEPCGLSESQRPCREVVVPIIIAGVYWLLILCWRQLSLHFPCISTTCSISLSCQSDDVGSTVSIVPGYR